MSFLGKYQFLSARVDGECQSVRALQISTGLPVLVHYLPAGETPPHQPDLESLIFRFLRGAWAEESGHFLDMGEDEGRIFVVTADVPECLDLRKWLQSVTEVQAGKEGATQLAVKSPGPANLEYTQNYTTQTLRQVVRSPGGAPIPLPVKSSGVLIPPAMIPAVSSEVTDSGSPSFSGFWEKSAPASSAGHPASIPTPPTSPKIPDGPSEDPEVTAEFLSLRSSRSVRDAPTEPMRTLVAQAADRVRPPATKAGPAEAKGNAGQVADLVPTHPEVTKPPVASSKVEVSYPSPQRAVTPAAPGPETKTPRAITEPFVENTRALPQVAASASSPNAYDKTEAGATLAGKAPRRQAPMGFEVVFQSSKPRSHPTLSGLPNKSGIMAAPTPMVPSAVTPPAEKIAGTPAIGSPWAPGEQRQAVGAKKDPPEPPWSPLAQQAVKESEQSTRLGPTPPMPPARPSSPAPPGDFAPTGRARPPLPALGPSPPSHVQPGEYTQMTENNKAAAGPLPLEVPPAGYRPAANPAVSAPAPAPAPYLGVPASPPPPYRQTPPQFRPSVPIVYSPPSRSAGKKRQVWVPILIFSSLFLMTVALLLFFAFKP